jgi:hypothetical protein
MPSTTSPRPARRSASCWLSAAGASLNDVAEGADPVRLRYEDLVDQLMGVPGVTPPRGGSGFGRSALRYQGRIFAMLVRGQLVVKLPASRMTALIRSGNGTAFDANKGTPMREWLSLDPGSELDWLALATEALDFARAGPAR